MDSEMNSRDDNHGHDDIDPHYNNLEVGDDRPPQFNVAIRRSRIGCACGSSRGTGESDSDGGGGGGGDGHFGGDEAGTSQTLSYVSSDCGSDDGNSSVDGEEGADRKIEVGPHGKISVRLIKDSLAEHGIRICRIGILPPEDDYPSSSVVVSPSASCVLPIDSTLVEPGSGEHSMTTSLSSLPGLSIHSFASRSTSPGACLANLGGWQDDVSAPMQQPQPQPQPRFIEMPLWLAHERGYCLNMTIGMECTFQYNMELSFTQDGPSNDAMSEYRGSDIW